MTDPSPQRAARDVLCRPLPAALALVAVLFVLSFGMSTGGYLGTDTGAKVATLDVMEQRGTARPVVGYWAEDFDPDGNLHPIYDSRPSDGDWVHVTTLPMLQLARPLWSAGGYRATLLLPILAAVATAFACRSLARRAGGEQAGWQAFWIVGLGSPITVYALDFWEHAPGAACMVGAIALLVGIVDGDPPVWRAIGAGALFGVAAAMRTEAFAYTFVAVAITCVVLGVFGRAWLVAIKTGALAVVGFAGPWIANAALEDWLGGNPRGVRLSSAANNGVSRWGERFEEAIITLLAMRPGSASEILPLGVLSCLLVAGALIADRRGDQRIGMGMLGGLVLLNLLVLADGLGFVPGMLAAAPLGVAAVVIRPEDRASRTALTIALAALPLVWAFQFTGGAGPQWAGRYILTSGMVLMALGVAAMQRCSVPVRRLLFGVTIGVTATGLLWLSERSHDVERLFGELVDRPEDVIVARNGFFLREGGTTYLDRRWLVAVSDDDLEEAVAVVGEAGLDTFAVLDEEPDAPSRIGAAEHTGDVPLEVVGVPLYLHSYSTGSS